MWIARGHDFSLRLFINKPYRDVDINGDLWNDGTNKSFLLYSLLFPNLKWEDEPIEVEIVSKQFMDMWRAKNNIMLQMMSEDEDVKPDDKFEPIDIFDIM